MIYVIAGKLFETVNTDLNERVKHTGGWRTRTINGKSVQWNACVSPPFGGGDKYAF